MISIADTHATRAWAMRVSLQELKKSWKVP